MWLNWQRKVERERGWTYYYKRWKGILVMSEKTSLSCALDAYKNANHHHPDNLTFTHAHPIFHLHRFIRNSLRGANLSLSHFSLSLSQRKKASFHFSGQRYSFNSFRFLFSLLMGVNWFTRWVSRSPMMFRRFAVFVDVIRNFWSRLNIIFFLFLGQNYRIDLFLGLKSADEFECFICWWEDLTSLRAVLR